MPKKILHLKENGGRYFYRRRVPERHQKTLGIKMWNRGCDCLTAKNISENCNSTLTCVDDQNISSKIYVARLLQETPYKPFFAPYLDVNGEGDLSIRIISTLL